MYMFLFKRIFHKKKIHADLFDRLEHEASDELALLAELGPQGFDTEYLIELHAQVCTRIISQKRALSLSAAVGAASAGWVLLGLFAWFMDSSLLSMASFAASIICMLAFAGMVAQAYVRFGTHGQLVHTRLSIEDELRSRRGRVRRQRKGW
ncbi:MAG: hypothetical protein ACK5VB_07075 [Bacteroidota bacterium]|jgi:hypothetical protein|nr:hypothetical protein [Saprospiraceae bacterium]